MEKEIPNFYEHTYAMSGVSGGALGQAFYFSLKKENKSKADIAQKIDRIGQGNFLSTDIAYLLGRDRIGFGCRVTPDRSAIAMKNYWKVIRNNDNQTIPSTSFQQYWSEYNLNSGQFPALIVNTAGTKRAFAGALSTYVPLGSQSIFPGTTDILNLDPDGKSTLSFFNTVSTSERFPFFSSTATIDGKGHFLDGGYFDNSGLLTLMNLRDHFLGQDTTKPKVETLIICSNQKEFNIKSILQDTAFKNMFVHFKSTTDLKAILNAVITIDKLPHYLTNLYQSSPRFSQLNTVHIQLPHKLRYNDFLDYLEGDPDSTSIEIILKMIKTHNDQIDTARKEFLQSTSRGKFTEVEWYFANPTLSRYLSKPAYNHEKAMMLHHPTIRKLIHNINTSDSLQDRTETDKTIQLLAW